MSADEERDRTSVRQVRCRDRLWQTFEQMSEEQEKSVEELINDAMTGYAQIAGYETAVHAQTPPPTPAPLRGARSQPFIPPAPARAGRATTIQAVRVGGGGAGGGAGSVAGAGGAGITAGPPPVPDAGIGGALYLVFDNQKYRIDKDQFIIGRGTKSSDLPIKDGNISRKHAAVIRRNGTFFIKDLGSTNGIDFNGMRIDNKRIDEGDVFHICEYELKFTYKR